MAAARGRRQDRLPHYVLALAWAFIILAFFLAPVAVTLDGPSHLYGAHVLKELLRHQPDFQAHFKFNSILVPNWLATLLLAALTTVMPDRMAIAAMMTLVSAGMLLGLYSCVSDTDQRRSQVLLVLTPLAISVFLTWAFWGFLISSALCFYAKGKRQLRVAAMLLLAYWAHPLPVILSGGFRVCEFAVEEWRRRGWKTTPARFAAAVWPWLLPLGLCAWFAAGLISSEVAPAHDSMREVFRSRLMDFGRMGSLIDMSPTPSIGGIFVLLLGVLGVGALLNKGERSMPIFMLVLLLGYFAVPDSVGNGAWIAIRILYYLAIFVTLYALTPGRMGERHLALCSVLAAICVFSFGVEYLLASKRLSPAVEELRSAIARVPRNSRVIMLTYDLEPDCDGLPLLDRTIPERHWAMLGAAERELIVLNDYEAATAHFPVQYRGTPFKNLFNEFEFTSESQTKWTDALRNSSAVDYVISWGAPSGVPDCAARVGAPLEDSLRSKYDLVVRSAVASQVEIWNRKAE